MSSETTEAFEGFAIAREQWLEGAILEREPGLDWSAAGWANMPPSGEHTQVSATVSWRPVRPR